MPQVTGGTPLAPAAPRRFASFGERCGSAIVDGILLMVLVFPALFILGVLLRIAGDVVGMPEKGILLVVKLSKIALVVLVRWLYFAGCESSSWQGTMGKRVVGIGVTDLDGQRISFGRATARFFSKYISLIGLGFGYWSVLWDPRSQGWHDRIADTLVLKK